MTGYQCEACRAGVCCFDAHRCVCCSREPAKANR